MNFGRGIRTGRFRITNSLGGSHTINVTENQATVADILQLINSQSDVSQVVATINANGDGIMLTDSAGGTLALRVEDLEGGAARDLFIEGEAEQGTQVAVALKAGQPLVDVLVLGATAGERLAEVGVAQAHGLAHEARAAALRAGVVFGLVSGQTPARLGGDGWRRACHGRSGAQASLFQDLVQLLHNRGPPLPSA